MAEDKDTERDINIFDYLIVILRRKKMIGAITASAAAVTAVVSLLMPPVYQAETRILPPWERVSGPALQILSQPGLRASGMASGPLGITDPNEIFVGMLKSRTVYDRIIERFGLMELYEAEYREDARKKLHDSVRVQSGKDEIITLSVEDESPERAADMANAFIDELKGLTQKLAVTEASKRRLFFHRQVEKVRDDLLKAEEALMGYQEKTGAISMDQQSEAVIESISRLRAQVAAKEVELQVMKTYATEQNPDLQKRTEELRGLKKQLLKLEQKDGRNPDPLVPTGRIPEVGTKYSRKLRNLKYHEALYELLAKQYEIARVDEARDATLIQVLDRAIPPEKKAKPKRALMVAVAAVAGLFLSILAAFLAEYLESASSSSPDRMEELGRHFPLIKGKQKDPGGRT